MSLFLCTNILLECIHIISIWNHFGHHYNGINAQSNKTTFVVALFIQLTFDSKLLKLFKFFYFKQTNPLTLAISLLLKCFNYLISIKSEKQDYYETPYVMCDLLYVCMSSVNSLSHK